MTRIFDLLVMCHQCFFLSSVTASAKGPAFRRWWGHDHAAVGVFSPLVSMDEFKRGVQWNE